MRVLIIMGLFLTGCATGSFTNSKHATYLPIHKGNGYYMEVNGYKYLTFNSDKGPFVSTLVTPPEFYKDIQKAEKWDKQLVDKYNKIKVSKKVNSYIHGQVQIEYYFNDSKNRFLSMCFEDSRYPNLKPRECFIIPREDWAAVKKSMKNYKVVMKQIDRKIAAEKELK